MVISTYLIFLFLLIGVQGISVQLIPSTGTPPSNREFPGFAINTSNNKLYVYGGYSETFTDDMWEFDLSTNRWNELHTTSVINPGARTDPFLVPLQNQAKILLFGGQTKSGPLSDLWLYDIPNQSWKTLDEKGSTPPRGYYRSICSYLHQGKQYLAVYGGVGKDSFIHSLFILDIETFIWNEVLNYGITPPNTNSQRMTYKDEKLYIWGADGMLLPPTNEMFVYDINSSSWAVLEIQGPQSKSPVSYGFCAYKDSLYVINGYDRYTATGYEYINRLNIETDFKEWQIYDTKMPNMAVASFGYICNDNMVYIFGGFNNLDSYNDIWSVDLNQHQLVWTQLSKQIKTPTARSGHAMEVYDDKLFILGGVDKYGKKLINIWTFDIETEDWDQLYTVSNISPSPRSNFAHTRSGEIIILFGGETDTITTGEMYTLNLRTREWKLVEVRSTENPTPRSGSCMGSAGGLIFIFGGKTDSGYTNDLWMFDPGSNSYKLLRTYGDEPPFSANGNCKAYVDSNDEIIFESYMGDTLSGRALSSVYRYTHSNKKWNKIMSSEKYESYARSLTSALFMGNKLLIAGGSEWEYVAHNEVYLVDTHTGIGTIVTNLPNFTYNAASVFYKNKLYIYGGSASFGTLPMPNIPKNDLTVINLDDDCQKSLYLCSSNCSEGTYYTGKDCASCPIGSYSDSVGSTECNPCPAGFYSDTKGADSNNICKPCDDGHFNSAPGQSMCLECSYGSICSLNKCINESKDYYKEMLISDQPDLLENFKETSSKYSFYFNLGIYLFTAVIIILLVSVNRTRKLVTRLDIYKLNHNYQENKFMIIRKTLIGGLCTLIFLAISMSILFSMSMTLAIDNIQETKALVPLVALEEKYESFIAEDLSFEVTYHEYGGQCVDSKNQCIKDLSISSINIEGKIHHKSCRKQDYDCIVSFMYSNFELLSTGSITLELNEVNSYASDISVKASCFSSIPDEYSTITSFLSKDKEVYFRGPDPSIFHLVLTPSLFLNDSGDWEKELRGYHVSQLKDPDKGSQIHFSEISFVKNLKVKISLEKNGTALLTQRLEKQAISQFFSNLAGSVLGILGAVGFVMSKLEDIYEKCKRRIVNKHSFREIVKNRLNLKNLNLKELKSEIVKKEEDSIGLSESLYELPNIDRKQLTDRYLTWSLEMASIHRNLILQ